MKRIILACPTIRKELEKSIIEAKSDSLVYFMPQSLHSNPPALGKYIQNYIDHLFNVDQVIVCASGCGGGTIGLKATTAEIVIPRTRDCLDVLLSNNDSLDTLDREMGSVFLTASWWDFIKNSDMALDKLIAKKGAAEAKAYLKDLYAGFNDFKLIDTGCFDVPALQTEMQPFVDAVDGTVTIIKGQFGILRKIAATNFDDDFCIVPKGEELPRDFVKLY